MDARIHQLHALSPLDGRYQKKVQNLSSHFSEFGLMKYRLHVEIEYLLFLSEQRICPAFSTHHRRVMRKWVSDFADNDAVEIKTIEEKIHHDVKAIEYYMRAKMQGVSIPGEEWIHFGLTSEDTNSLAYGVLMKQVLADTLIPKLEEVVHALTKKSREYADTVMLARTHGQPAVPTTMGKELAVFAVRVSHELELLRALPIEGKCSGAVGNFNAHTVAYPDHDWSALSHEFVRSLGLTPNEVTTQILPADALAKIFASFTLMNTVLIGFCQDMWRYISDDYFVQRVDEHQVGSSTMPQKINPIDFENAEGNFGIANALFEFFIRKLLISRLQRDLSDSTVKRTIGVAFGHSILAYDSLLAGLGKLNLNENVIKDELDAHWEIITEGIQTILRTLGDKRAYEKLKSFSRGKKITKKDLLKFITELDVDESVRMTLRSVTPSSYTGIASKIVQTKLGEKL